MSLTPPAVRHPVVQRGDHRAPRPALPRVRHQAVPGAVRRVALHAGAVRARRRGHPAVPRGPDRRAARRPAGADGRGGRGRALRAGGPAARRRARRSQTLRDRQQKMATVELGDRDVFGIKAGPAGASIQVFQVRHGRVIERIDLFAETRDAAGADAAARAGRGRPGGRRRAVSPRRCRRRCSSSTRTARCRPEIHVPVELPEAEVHRGLAVGAGRPARPPRRAQARREARAARPRGPQRRAGLPGALQPRATSPTTTASTTLRVGARPARPAAPDRVLRHLHHPGQRDGRVDGRVRGRPDEALGVPEVP